VADSKTSQETIWDWYWGDFFTRLRPGAAQVVIMTRWSEGDLGGRLEEAEGAAWRIVRVPAIAEAGDPLGRAPGAFLWEDDNYGFAAKLRADFASFNNAGRSRDWAALYQQTPVPDSGNYFRRDWLRSVPTLPPRAGMRVFGASDYAVTDDGGDFTVHVVVGVDSDDRLYVLDLWREQASSDRWVEAFCDLVIRWKPMGWAEETGQIRAGIGPWLDRRSRERRAFVARETFPTRGDKSVRAQSIRGRAALSGLYVAADAPWRATFEAELLSFPAGKHDDIVDSLGLAGQLLDLMLPPAKPKPDRPPEDTWDRAFRRSRGDDDDGWRVA
jgi:predicted phage terminase large subunit-like protein